MRLFIIFTLFSLSIITQATTYYISNTGNDNNSGTSITSPWKTINKVNQQFSSFLPGDSIMFEKGNIFNDQLNIEDYSGNNTKILYFGAYGSGNNPIISGSKKITSWIKSADNTWYASCPDFSNRIVSLYIDNIFQPIGRYPNKGYRTINSTSNGTQITDKNLDSPNNHWNSGEIVIKTRRWFIKILDITSSSGDIINFSQNNSYSITPGFGYFIQNQKNTLDLNNEWYFDKEEEEIFILKQDGIDPNTQKIEANYYSYGIYLSNSSNVTIDGVNCANQLVAGVKIYSSTDINLLNCKIDNSSDDNLFVDFSSDINISNNEFNNACDDAVVFKVINDLKFTNNTIKNTGKIAGCFDGQPYALTMGSRLYSTSNMLIKNNKIDSSGYIGISFYGSDIKIINNYINNSLLVLDDGGGIYTYFNQNEGNEIIGNIVLNSIGTNEGVKYNNPSASVGIYIDDLSEKINIKGNTVAYCGKGIFIHNSKDIKVLENTSFQNSVAQLGMSQSTYNSNGTIIEDNIRNVVVQNNVLFGTKTGEYCYYMSSQQDDISSFGSFSDNYIYNPFDSVSIYNRYSPNYPDSKQYINKLFTLADWQETTNGSTNSKTSPVFWDTEYEVTDTISDNYISNADFATGIDGWRGAGTIPPVITYETDTSIMRYNCLKSEFPVNSGQINVYYYPTFQIIKDKVYEVSFSIKGDNSGGVITKISNSGGSDSNYDKLDAPQMFQFTTEQKRYNLLVRANSNSIAEGARLVFEFHAQGATIWLDDISLKEIDATIINRSDYLHFYSNATNKDTTVNFPNQYRNLDWEAVSNVRLESFKSEIFFTDDSITSLYTVPHTIHARNHLTVYPNPANQYLNFKADQEIEQITVINSIGQIILQKQQVENRVDISNIPSGIYIIYVKTDDVVMSSKIIIY